MFSKIFPTILITLLLGPMVLTVSGCGPGSGKNKNSVDPLAEITPIWTNITYINNGAAMTLNPPFTTTQAFMADPGSGGCTGNTTEVVFNGTYNQTAISKLTLTGMTTTESNSADTFRFTGCMAFGATSVTITAYDTKDQPVRVTLNVSLATVTNTTTLGYGHPNYPATGFSLLNVAPNLANLTSAGTTLTNFYMGPVGSQTKSSTGNTGYIMELGFANYIKQFSP